VEVEVVVGANDAGTNCVLPLPFDPKEVFGRARAPVVVRVGDAPAFRTTVAVYGGVGIIGLRKAQSAELGIAVGDTVRVRIEPDTEPRTVPVPADLAEALAGAAAASAAFEGLSLSHRREYVRWVEEAKRPATRATRIAKTLDMLLAGIRTPH
jgi:hypothetical protein